MSQCSVVAVLYSYYTDCYGQRPGVSVGK